MVHVISIQRKKRLRNGICSGLAAGRHFSHPVDRKQTLFMGGLGTEDMGLCVRRGHLRALECMHACERAECQWNCREPAYITRLA